MRQDRSARFVRLSTGVSLRYVTSGDDSETPVLLLHPWGESLSCFDEDVDALMDALGLDTAVLDPPADSSWDR